LLVFLLGVNKFLLMPDLLLLLGVSQFMGFLRMMLKSGLVFRVVLPQFLVQKSDFLLLLFRLPL